MGRSPQKEDNRSWTEKYRPRTLDELAGHLKPVQDMRNWARGWSSETPPKKKALILEGEPGVGKTSAAIALAGEMGWETVELNASDARNAESIRASATRGALSRDVTDQSGYEGGSPPRPKLILIDEADNLFERSASTEDGSDMGDKGGKRAIVELVRLTKQPVILIVNDLYGLTSGSGAALNPYCEKIKFRRLAPASIANRLRKICAMEKVVYEDDLIKAIAERAAGDMRSAVGDLQMVCAGKKRVGLEDMDILGLRDTKENIFGALDRVFRASSVKAARTNLNEVDEDIETLVLWMAENVPTIMPHPEDLDRGMSMISRADVYLGRVKRRQNYGLWNYAKDSLAALAIAKQFESRTREPYRFPSYLRSMAATKEPRALLKETANMIGRLTHTSVRGVKEDALCRFGLLCQRDPEFAANLVASGGLSRDHLKILTGCKLKDEDMERIMEDAEALRDQMALPRPSGAALEGWTEGGEGDVEGASTGPTPEQKGDAGKEEKAAAQSKLLDF